MATLRDVTPHMAADRDLPGPYSERQSKGMNRPVAPSIFDNKWGVHYQWPLVALSSITNRVTGVLLTAGMGGMGAVALVGGDPTVMAQAIGSSAVGPVMKFGVAFPLVYHYIVGVRHYMWDTKIDTLQNEQCQSSSMAVFGAGGGISLIAAIM